MVAETIISQIPFYEMLKDLAKWSKGADKRALGKALRVVYFPKGNFQKLLGRIRDGKNPSDAEIETYTMGENYSGYQVEEALEILKAAAKHDNEAYNLVTQDLLDKIIHQKLNLRIDVMVFLHEFMNKRKYGADVGDPPEVGALLQKIGTLNKDIMTLEKDIIPK